MDFEGVSANDQQHPQIINQGPPERIFSGQRVTLVKIALQTLGLSRIIFSLVRGTIFVSLLCSHGILRINVH